MAEEKKSRDRQGRWVKGVTGNPKGRPHKFARIDFGNLGKFKNTVIEVNTPDGRIVMTRDAAVLHRLYQSAMKGNVHAQIFLARRFEKHTEDKLGVAAELHRMIAQIKEAKRAPTDYELALIEAARAHLDPYKSMGMEPPKPGSVPRSRRKPRRKGKKSDAGSDL